MHKTTLGVRPQHFHNHIPTPVLEWFKLHYGPSPFNGRIQLAIRKKGSRSIWPLHTGTIASMTEFLSDAHISQNRDYYITANSISGVHRQAESLFSLHNIVIDIDAHGVGEPEITSLAAKDTKVINFSQNPFATSLPSPLSLSYEQNRAMEEFAFRLRRDVFSDTDFPAPNSIVMTGRGIQLWWAIVPMSYKCLPWYKEIQQTFVERLRVFLDEYPDEFAGIKVDAAASSNAVGYFRLPGTMNTNTDTSVELIYVHNERLDTHKGIEWAKKWAMENVEEAREVSQRKPPEQDAFSGKYLESDIYIFKNVQTMALFRLRQLIRLRLLRDNDVGSETRNNMCLIAYNSLLPSLGPDEAWDKLLSFNAGFKTPMTERELQQTICSSAKKGGYRYKNETIISFLGMTPQEQEATGLYVPADGSSPFVRMSTKPSRTAARKAVKDDRNAKIKRMSEQGFTRKRISEELGIDRKTVTAVLGSTVPCREVVSELRAKGFSTRQIAEQLGVSMRTAQMYSNDVGTAATNAEGNEQFSTSEDTSNAETRSNHYQHKEKDDNSTHIRDAAFELLSQGKPLRAVAEELGISIQLAQIYEKIQKAKNVRKRPYI
jgi:Response regulator containing a CheY-like receiver domain and an HTH DNA-binding domain